MAAICFGAASVLISVVPLIGLALPLRDATGVVSREYTQLYGAKYSSNDRMLHYIVVNGTSFMTNNDGDSASPAIGDTVRLRYHEGVNEIVHLEIMGRPGSSRSTPKRISASDTKPNQQARSSVLVSGGSR